jgi:hypothetical protein
MPLVCRLVQLQSLLQAARLNMRHLLSHACKTAAMPLQNYLLLCSKPCTRSISSCEETVLCIVQGYNGSQLWDTSFAVQAMLDTGLTQVAGAALKKAHSYIEQSQVR